MAFVQDRLAQTPLDTGSSKLLTWFRLPQFSSRLGGRFFAQPKSWNWLWQPLGWFLAAIAISSLVGAFVAPQGWLLAAALAVVLLGGVSGPWLCLCGIHAELHFERKRISENQPVLARLTLANRLPWPGWGFLLKGGSSLRSSSDNDPVVAALTRIPGWSRIEFEFKLHFARRGRYPAEPMILSCGFPFGIWHAKKAIVVRDELIVVPHQFPLRLLPQLPGDELTALGSYRDRAGSEGEILSARAYRPGDPLRQVHWRHTARRDTLIVNERQSIGRPQVLLVWDELAFTSPEMSQEDLDWGIRVLATLAGHYYHHGYSVSCSFNSRLQFALDSTAQWRQFLEILALYDGVTGLENPSSRLKSAHSKTRVCAFTITADASDTDHTFDTPSTRKLRIVGQKPGANSQLWLTVPLNHLLEQRFIKEWEVLSHVA